MSDGGGALEAAHEAAGRGDWRQAFGRFTEADAQGLLGPADLPVLAAVAYAAGELDATIETWERAHAGAMQVGDQIAAAGAAVRVAMHLLIDTALMAPVRGWVARAERLVGDRGDTPVHAWLAMVHTYERLLSGDLDSARTWARRTVEVGSSCDPAAAAIGRVAEARILILDGAVDEGLALLDEAGVAAVSGDLDPLSTGVVYCELVCALQGAAQYDRAEEWTEAMERWSRTNAIGSIHGRCRVHRAEILRLRGSCDDAEKEALLACEELRPFLRREMGWPLSELGRIRLHKGDLEGAGEALVAAYNGGWDPQPGLALVQLAQGGDPAAAAAAIREALERPMCVPSKELPPCSDLRRAPLLEAQVEVELATGDLDRARSAADELEGIAARFQSRALIAGAVLARGRVRLAEGDVEAAEQLCSDAVRLWNEVGAPYEAARARVGLADAHRARGNDQRAAVELQAARAVLDRMGTTARVGRVRDEDGVQVFRREGDYWLVVFDGRAVRMRDLKGMHYLARLLAEPGREFHVLDLVAAEAGGSGAMAQSDAGEMLDATAKEAYRRRLAEIEEDVEQAQASGDAERAAQAQAERDFLVRELSRAVGLRGQDRRAGSGSERARAAVTRALRQAMARIGEHHPHVGEHLDRTIRTGTYCSYLPDSRVRGGWQL